MESYKKLEAHFAPIVALKQIEGMLDWDRSVMMPPDGGEQRGQQLAVLNTIIHGMETNPLVGEWIAKINRSNLDPWEGANVDQMERAYRHATALPEELVTRKIRQEAVTEALWRKARQDNDFKLIAPELAKLMEIVREMAEMKTAVFQKPLYDVMLDAYAPGMTAASIETILTDLAAFLPSFIDEVLFKQAGLPPVLPLPGPFPRDLQEKLCTRLIHGLGLGAGFSRLDTSTHPFSSGSGNDIRITTRYDLDSFLTAMQGAAHEAGHSLYDHNIPKAWQGQPVGVSVNMGMAIHESQSLMLDMQLLRSRAFWTFMAPAVRDMFGSTSPALEAENLFRHMTRVERGFIRVNADEVTYPAHIILRYRLEKAMIQGQLKVADLPEAWNEGFRELLGFTPPNDREGCLQDIHWYVGAVGYFPAYAIGAVTAAQFTAKMRQDVPNLDQQIAQGHSEKMTHWLRDNIHRHGCSLQPDELILKASGQPLSTAAFKEHLTRRYLKDDTND